MNIHFPVNLFKREFTSTDYLRCYVKCGLKTKIDDVNFINSNCYKMDFGQKQNVDV